MLSEECLASTAICTSRGDLDLGKVWTLSKSFCGLEIKTLRLFGYLFVWVYIYMIIYVYIYIRIFVEARYV